MVNVSLPPHQVGELDAAKNSIFEARKSSIRRSPRCCADHGTIATPFRHTGLPTYGFGEGFPAYAYRLSAANPSGWSNTGPLEPDCYDT